MIGTTNNWVGLIDKSKFLSELSIMELTILLHTLTILFHLGMFRHNGGI